MSTHVSSELLGRRATAKDKTGEAAEGQVERRRLRVPTSVLLTLLVAVLSVLVGPAFARQWEDRQEALQVKAVIADEIATAAARTVGAGDYVARAQQRDARRRRVLDARAFWAPVSLRIETKLRAYFAPGMATQWERLASDVDGFLDVCAWAAPPGRFVDSQLTDESRRANIEGWLIYMWDRHPQPEPPLPGYFKDIAQRATDPDPEVRAGAVDAGVDLMIAETKRITADLFDAHPAGFSTTRGDLLRDVLPLFPAP